MAHDEQRAELANFLRTRRGQLSPTEVGLPRTARRKTAGLRREEVAQLAGIGVTWYTWLEQGRDIRVSTQILDSLTQSLRLTPAEKAHLYILAGQAPPPYPVPQQEQVSPFLQHLITQLGHNPAYITGRRWDLLAWNRAACQVFTNFEAMPPEERNIMRLIFTNEEYRQRMVDWESVAQRALAQFRASSSRYHDDPQWSSLIAELQQSSPEFTCWWSRHEVLERKEGQKQMIHPIVDLLTFEHSTMQIEDAPGLKLVIYLPANQETAHKLAQLGTL